jgi:pimeloyl-ACP methyl ester carboxylesterase
MFVTIALQVTLAAILSGQTVAPQVPGLEAQVDTAWPDPSPHRTRFVRVSNAVKLEVLDWGGSGAPLVFLAGGGHSAHVYDQFATRFTGRYQVLGITRRGSGKSSHPKAGYDTTTLVRDIVAVLDSLGLRKASFAAHSFGGSELNLLGAHYPGRVNRLVYLDSGFDFKAIDDSPEWKSGVLQAPQPPIPPYDDAAGSAWSWTLWAERLSGPGVPEAEVRTLYRFDGDGRFVGDTDVSGSVERLVSGTEPVDLRGIRAPALALYAVLDSPEAMLPYWHELDPTSRARGQKMFEALTRLHDRLRADFSARVEGARVIRIHGARHYIFLTHPAEVTHAMLEFLAGA